MKQLDSIYDTPLVILRHNRKISLYSMGTFFIITVVFIFGIILPVLMTGDYNSVLGEWTLGEKIEFFYLAWPSIVVTSVLLILSLGKIGIYYFYDDRVELHTYWIKRKIVIPYDRMHVVRERDGLTITAQSLPSPSHPLQRFKEKYWNGLGLTTIFDDSKYIGISFRLFPMSSLWENPQDGPKALQIIKERAFSYEEK